MTSSTAFWARGWKVGNASSKSALGRVSASLRVTAASLLGRAIPDVQKPADPSQMSDEAHTLGRKLVSAGRHIEDLRNYPKSSSKEKTFGAVEHQKDRPKAVSL